MIMEFHDKYEHKCKYELSLKLLNNACWWHDIITLTNRTVECWARNGLTDIINNPDYWAGPGLIYHVVPRQRTIPATFVFAYDYEVTGGARLDYHNYVP